MKFLYPKFLYQIAVCIAGCCFLLSCENDQQVIDTWTKEKAMQDEILEVETYMSQDGKLKAKLVAPLMLRVMATDSQYIEFPQSLHVDFYGDTLQIETYLDAKYSKYFERQNLVYLRDSVVVISMKGDTLRCHDLWWDQNKEIFYTDSLAVYTSPDNFINGGKGLIATQDFKKVTFKESTGLMDVGEDGFPTGDSTAAKAPAAIVDTTKKAAVVPAVKEDK